MTWLGKMLMVASVTRPSFKKCRRVFFADAKLAEVQTEIDRLLQGIPNLPHASVPAGNDENDNIEIRQWGSPVELSFEAKDHVDLGAELNGLDFDTAAKITGSRFSYMRGGLASLQRALTQFMLNTHVQDHGYETAMNTYQCPMKCEEDKTYGEEGSCPVCKMDLKKVEVAANDATKEEGGVE